MSKGERIRNERVSFPLFILQCLKDHLPNIAKVVFIFDENKRKPHFFISPFHFPHLNCRFMPKAHLIVNLLSNTSFLLSSSSFCVFKIKFFCAIPCKLKKNNLYLRLGKNNLNVHAYEDNVDFTNFSPLDIKNATFGSQGRYAGLYEKALH